MPLHFKCPHPAWAAQAPGGLVLWSHASFILQRSFRRISVTKISLRNSIYEMLNQVLCMNINLMMRYYERFCWRLPLQRIQYTIFLWRLEIWLDLKFACMYHSVYHAMDLCSIQKEALLSSSLYRHMIFYKTLDWKASLQLCHDTNSRACSFASSAFSLYIAKSLQDVL